MTEPTLNLDAVRAFVLTADLGSFSRAADLLGASQPAVSLKVKRLEDMLGQRLLARTPRHVGLTAQGAAFLEAARGLLDDHDRAVSLFTKSRQRLSVGISDHVAGPDLPRIVARMNAIGCGAVLDIRIGSSGELLQSFDRREIGSVIVRFENGRPEGRTIGRDAIGWYAAADWSRRPGEPLPVATMPEPCGVRMMACQALDRAGITWREVFTGGGVMAVAAAVTAGLGVAALARRMLPEGVEEVGHRLDLPRLPDLPVVLHTRETGAQADGMFNALAQAFARKPSAPQ